MKRDKLKALVMESVLESLNEQPQGEFEKQEFVLGQRQAMKDKKFGGSDRDIRGFSKAYQQGYKSVMGNTLWNKINNGITNFISGMGYSRRR